MNFLKKAFLTAAAGMTLSGCYVARPGHGYGHGHAPRYNPHSHHRYYQPVPKYPRAYHMPPHRMPHRH